MNNTLVRALVALVPISMLVSGAVALFARDKTFGSFLQLLGAASLALVVLTHICEALHWLPSMQWGLERSVGHYLDLSAAAVGVASFSLGYLLHALGHRST